MIILAYCAALVVTLWLLRAHFRGRTVEGLIRNPPAGSDLAAIVSTLSYLEHELIKHRIPVVRSLVAKRVWNREDFQLLARTIGSGDSSISAEFQRYLEGVQRGAGRTLVNIGRDRAFGRAEQALELVQRYGQRWLRSGSGVSPSERDRDAVEEACSWLSGPFRRYLVELNRSVYRCPISRDSLLRSARRGIAEASSEAGLIVDEAPPDCVASILPADLDVVIRNLVRNAAQVELPTGSEASIRIDVAELLEETGEESILVNVHDRCPRLLSTDDIYGRDASRGLGLVTTAVARHGGAVRSVQSGQDGFEKALQIRLSRSLHEPDHGALDIARLGLRTYLYLGLAAVLHAVVIALVVLPFFSPHPLEGLSPSAPEGCVVDTNREDVDLTLVCDLFDAAGELRRSPIRLQWPGESEIPDNPERSGSACMAVETQDDGESIAILAAECLNGSSFEPSLTLRFASFWRRADYRVLVELRSSTTDLIEASRAAAVTGRFDLADRLTYYLLGGQRRGLTQTQRHQVLYWSGAAAVLEGLLIRLQGDEEQSSDLLCALSDRTEMVARDFMALADAAEEPQRSQWLVDATYLTAHAALFITNSLEGAVTNFTELAIGDEGGRRAQAARFYLAVLLSEGAHGTGPGIVDACLTELWQAYQRPLLQDGWEETMSIALLGASAGGQMLRVPVPEALCAFRGQYPDVQLPAALTFTLTYTCGRGDVDPTVDEYLARLGQFIREAREPLVCP